jgi:anti-anti-sigma regulatory factor
VSAAAAPSADGLRLADQCGIRDSAALRQELLSLLDVPAPVAIDAGAVQRADTTTLQLLYAFERDRATRGLKVIWGARSAAFSQAAAQLGLAFGAAGG